MKYSASARKLDRSDDIVRFDVSASAVSVLAEEESSAAVDEKIPPDQEALGMIFLFIKVMRHAQESSRLVGSTAAIVVRAAPEWAVDTQGAVVIVSFVRACRDNAEQIKTNLEMLRKVPLDPE